MLQAMVYLVPSIEVLQVAYDHKTNKIKLVKDEAAAIKFLAKHKPGTMLLYLFPDPTMHINRLLEIHNASEAEELDNLD